MEDTNFPEHTEVTREELYERIWKTPTSVLCKEFGISDKGLAKVCVKFRIPKPGPGYWRKLECGVQMPVDPLPSYAGPNELVIRRRHFPNPNADNLPTVVIPKRLENPHVILKSLLEYQDIPKLQRGAVPTERIIFLRCSSRTQPRALRILDALFKNLEQRGCSLSIGDKAQPIAEKLGEQIKFQLIETEPGTGDLCLFFDSVGEGIRHTWRDGKRKRLEHTLSQFIYWLEMCFEIKRKRTEHWKHQRLEWEKQAQERRREGQREKFLLNQIALYETTTQIERYVKALTRGEVKFAGDVTSWIEWIRSYIDLLRSGEDLETPVFPARTY